MYLLSTKHKQNLLQKFNGDFMYFDKEKKQNIKYCEYMNGEE